MWLVGASPLRVELSLVRVGGHRAKNTSEEHLLAFYDTWEEVRHRKFDGFIITGAPIELLDYEDVTYWDEMKQILDWTKTNVHSTLNVCWGAMAAIYHFHGVPKHTLEEKAFGVYRHHNRKPLPRSISTASPIISRCRSRAGRRSASRISERCRARHPA